MASLLSLAATPVHQILGLPTREAVRLVVEEGMGVREVERNLGITFGVVKGWVQKQRDHQDAAFVGRVAPNSPEAELKRLRKENERLQRERNILKKAVDIILNESESSCRFTTEHRSEYGVQEMCRVPSGSARIWCCLPRLLNNFARMESEQVKIASGG